MSVNNVKLNYHNDYVIVRNLKFKFFVDSLLIVIRYVVKNFLVVIIFVNKSVMMVSVKIVL